MIHRLLWLLAFLSSLLGAAAFVVLFPMAESAPQEASAAAFSLALAAIPYVMARAWDEMRGYERPVRLADQPSPEASE